MASVLRTFVQRWMPVGELSQVTGMAVALFSRAEWPMRRVVAEVYCMVCSTMV